LKYTIFKTTYSKEEAERFVFLRKLEWEAFPVFATRAFAPVALFWLSWWQLALAFVLASLVWCPVREYAANIRVATAASALNNIVVSLVGNVVIAVVFFVEGKTVVGCIALVWHFVSSLLAFAYPPSRSLKIQEKFWEGLNRTREDAQPTEQTRIPLLLLKKTKLTYKIAVWSLAFGVLGLYSSISSVGAIVCGHIALARLRKNQTKWGRWQAITGLVLGYAGISLILVYILLGITVGSIWRLTEWMKSIK
jgi:hypothetical protein